MKVQYASDLHLEMTKMPRFEVLPDADLLVLAGDTHSNPTSMRKFLNKVHRNYPELVIAVVPGNHEYYGHVVQSVRTEYADACEDIGNVHYLDNGYLEMGHYRIIGTTLYSDLHRHPLDAIAAKQHVTDFRVVRIKTDKGTVSLTTHFWTEQHMLAQAFLMDALEVQPVATNIVVTHFVPSLSLCTEQFKNHPSNAAFLADMDQIIEQYKPALWVYGHDHRPHIDTMLYQTRVVCNQRGYHYEGNDYKPRLVEVP